jgi:hypothetical protein
MSLQSTFINCKYLKSEGEEEECIQVIGWKERKKNITRKTKTKVGGK